MFAPSIQDRRSSFLQAEWRLSKNCPVWRPRTMMTKTPGISWRKMTRPHHGGWRIFSVSDTPKSPRCRAQRGQKRQKSIRGNMSARTWPTTSAALAAGSCTRNSSGMRLLKLTGSFWQSPRRPDRSGVRIPMRNHVNLIWNDGCQISIPIIYNVFLSFSNLLFPDFAKTIEPKV